MIHFYYEPGRRALKFCAFCI